MVVRSLRERIPLIVARSLRERIPLIVARSLRERIPLAERAGYFHCRKNALTTDPTQRFTPLGKRKALPE